jgi:hypothetical protein
MRTCLATALIALSYANAIAQDFSWPTGTHGTSGSFGGTVQGVFHTETDGTYSKGNHNPDSNEQERLIVQWGNVSMGYVDDNEVLKGDQLWRTWKDDNSLRRDRRLSIRGRVFIQSLDRRTRRPIDWVQGVRVIVSRLPNTKHDWSRRQEIHEAAWSDCVIWSNGEFLAQLWPSQVQRLVGKDSLFQIALSLGKKEGTAISWQNTVGVLPQSVAMLKFPGPPEIGKTMQIINGAPSYSQLNFNPAKLVRAVNHLTGMGKARAIGELHAFLKIACDSYDPRRIDENIDTSDKTCVFLIVHLLFEPAEPGEKLPEILAVPFDPFPDKKDRSVWPLFPVYLQDDIPFFLPCAGFSSGLPDRPEQHVEWAEKHGRIRSKPLRPLDDPMIAAGRLIALPQTRRLYKDRNFKQILCQQAWNIVEDADPRLPKPKPIPPANTFEKVDWDARLEASSRLNIRWNEAEQRYIMK